MLNRETLLNWWLKYQDNGFYDVRALFERTSQEGNIVPTTSEEQLFKIDEIVSLGNSIVSEKYKYLEDDLEIVFHVKSSHLHSNMMLMYLACLTSELQKKSPCITTYLFDNLADKIRFDECLEEFEQMIKRYTGLISICTFVDNPK